MKRSERAVEQGGEPHLLAGHVREHGAAAEAGRRRSADRRKALVARSTMPALSTLERRRAKRQPPVELAVGERRVAAHLRRAARSAAASCPSGTARARAGRTGCSAPCSARSASSAVRRPLTSSRAVPFQALQLPSPSTVEGDRPPGPDHRSDHAVRRARSDSTSRSKRSRSGSASRISASFSPLCLTVAVEFDQRPARADVGLAAEPRHARLAGHRRADPKLGDVEAADAGCRSRAGSASAPRSASASAGGGG